MIHKSKTVMTQDFIYNLKYMAINVNEKYVLYIQSIKYNKRDYLVNPKTPYLAIETNFNTLPKTTTFSEVLDLLSEFHDNIVFPISLDYILEDMEIIKKGKTNYKIYRNEDKNKNENEKIYAYEN